MVKDTKENNYKKQERKLSKAEKIRKENFAKYSEEMEKKGYNKREITVGEKQINVIAALIMLPFVAVFFAIFAVVHDFHIREIFEATMEEFFLGFILIYVCIVIHELVHGITWAINCKKGFKSIAFGVMPELMTPYCHCCEALKKVPMILGIMMPTILLGIIPTIVAILLGNGLLLYVSLFNLVGGGGDFMIFLLVIKDKSKKETLYYDHPYEPGTVVFEKR
ncbi:MAG: DUF3267 domain-containing protein [Lachnospiraceae bacterium]|nr:DUF3267 domain-containing protein [Lachnospiraceae bacterium]